MANVIVRAYSRGREWDGPMRRWIDNRTRVLRDETLVHALVVFERLASDECLVWEIGLGIADYPEAMDVVQDLVSDLECLSARPELITEVERPDLRSSA